MKNPTILRDELGLLNADKSAVVTELRLASQQLKDTNSDIMLAEKKLKGVHDTILITTARLDDLRARAVSVRDEFNATSQDLRNVQQSYETFRVKNTQEIKLHLGRIKELGEQEEATLTEIAKLKALYDKNSDTYAQHLSERLTKLRQLDNEIKEKGAQLDKQKKEADKTAEADKKITKDRLKREDKIRTRERNMELRERAIKMREEDLITMSNDMTIVYGRLKELYASIDPNKDLDKLIIQIK